MSKEKVITINAEKLSNLADLKTKEVEIKSASLKDALCNYGYELLTGKTKGDVINRRGTHIIHEDLENAFDNFKVFAAHLDDAYTGNDNSTELSFLKEETETESYFVSGFKIAGVEENKSISLGVTKFVVNGSFSYDTPKVKLNGSYLYLSQLLEAIENVVKEVEYYMNGKSAPQPEQVHMDFASEDAAFDNAKFDEDQAV
jgi:hypothetical protein